MKSLRIMVVDDERVICDACHLVLTEEGHRVEEYTSGKAGLNAIRQGAYDVVLLDIKLPDTDGMEILNVVRKEKPDLCVIVMTGYSTVSNAIEAMKLGATGYLSKPFTDEELISALEKAINIKSRKPFTVSEVQGSRFKGSINGIHPSTVNRER